MLFPKPLVRLGLASAMALLPTAVQAALCPAQLASRLDAALARPPLATAYTGLVIQTQGPSPRTLYRHHGDRLFTPASSAKLLTTAAALHRLGADYRIRTSVYGSAPGGPGEVTALRVVGRGDPTLGNAQIDELAQQVAQAGVRQVTQLVVEDGYFPGPATNPTWEWGDAQWAYAAPVNSLIFNRNAVAVQVAPTQAGRPLAVTVAPLPAGPLALVNDSLTVAAGSPMAPLRLWRSGDSPTVRVTGQMAQGGDSRTLNLAVLNPGQQFAAALEQALGRRSVAVGRTVVSPTATAVTGTELAAVQSPPLGELLVPTNRDSDNLYAEALLHTLGAVAGAEPGEAAKAALAELGINAAILRVADGSGLSRHNLVSPDALVQILQAMAVHPQGQVFRNSLAVAGTSGTLRNRLGGTALAGRVQGKTGALTGNVALTAYVQPPTYPPLVVSVVINHSNQHASVLRQTIDELLLLVAQLRSDC